MVSFSDRNRYADPQMQFLMKSAVAQANGYILADGRTAIDAEQVERLKEDQRLIYEEETGQEISLLQWVARRLNADLYIEVDAAVDARTSGGSHYGRADVTLTMYEASTGQLLGSVNRRSQESYSRISQDDAIINALQATVYQAMPDVLEMSQRQMSIALRRGLRYDLTIQNPPDSRSVSLFRRALEQEVREIRTVSQVAQEVRYEVFLVGDTDDLVDLVSIVSGEVAGFEDLYLVISRGRAVTFDAGY